MSAAVSTASASGSQTTMSASEPASSAPLRGYMPKAFAGSVESRLQNASALILPEATPQAQTTAGRCSMPGRPFGIFEKLPSPSFFCSKVKEQWSVEIMSTSLPSMPCQSAALSDSLRMGGEQTNLAPSKSGFSYTSSVRLRYWGQVSTRTV